MEAIVLAGGLGTRLRSAVPDLPKPMAPVAGRPFLEFLLEYWNGQGVSRFILSVGYRRESITGHFGSGWRGSAVSYAVEESPLGTGGGLLLAMGFLKSPGAFLVLNGDTYFDVELRGLREFHAARGAQATMSLFRSPQDGRYTGIELGPEGNVLSLDAGRKGGLANGGVYLLERGVFEVSRTGRPSSLETDLLPEALAAGKRVYGRECAGTFIDIGIPEDYQRAPAVLGSRVA